MPAAKSASLPLPLPTARPRVQPPTYEVASVESKPVQLRPAQAASLLTAASPNDVINQRDYWRALQGADPADLPNARGRAQAQAQAPAPARRLAGPALASADPIATATLAPWPLSEQADAMAPTSA